MEPKAMLLGRFNYLSYRVDLFNVVFMPFSGASAMIVARNLDKDTCMSMIEEFNATIDRTRKELKAMEEEEEIEENDD